MGRRAGGTRLDIERCAACGYTLLVETRDDGTALEWELDETDYRNDDERGEARLRMGRGSE